MSDQKEICLSLPYVIVVPFRVQICDEISDGCKLYYGQIVPLAHKTGYMWATDQQLADMKGVTTRTIERYHQELEAQGFIRRETHNVNIRHADGSHTWVKKRKIYVNNAFASSMPEMSENTPNHDPDKNVGSLDPDKNVGSLDPDKNVGINNTPLDEILKKQSGVPDPVVISSSLEKIEICAKLKAKICSEYTPEQIDLAVERCLKWKTRPNDEAGIMTTLKRADTWQDAPTAEEKEFSDKEYLKSLHPYDGKTIAHTMIAVLSKHIEFICGMKVTVFTVGDKEFKQKISNYLEYLKKMEEGKRVVTKKEFDESFDDFLSN